VALGDATGLIEVRTRDDALQARWMAHPQPVRALRAVGADLLSVGGDGTVARWSADGDRRWRARVPDERLNDGDALDDGAVVAGARGTVARLTRDGVAWQAEAHAGTTFAVAASPDGARVASGGADGKLVVRDAADGRVIAEVRAHDGWLTALAWDAVGLVSGGADGRVRLWDAESLSPGPVLDVGGSRAIDLSTTPDRLLAVSEDGAVRLWPRRGGEPTLLAPPGDPWLSGVLTGDQALTGGRDGRVAIWDVRTGGRAGTLRLQGGFDAEPARANPGPGRGP
jgi:WD40 repeat protein